MLIYELATQKPFLGEIQRSTEQSLKISPLRGLKRLKTHVFKEFLGTTVPKKGLFF
jgi:hypothetical protein